MGIKIELKCAKYIDDVFAVINGKPVPTRFLYST
jgi:hypothetical protein